MPVVSRWTVMRPGDAEKPNPEKQRRRGAVLAAAFLLVATAVRAVYVGGLSVEALITVGLAVGLLGVAFAVDFHKNR